MLAPGRRSCASRLGRRRIRKDNTGSDGQSKTPSRSFSKTEARVYGPGSSLLPAAGSGSSCSSCYPNRFLRETFAASVINKLHGTARCNCPNKRPCSERGDGDQVFPPRNANHRTDGADTSTFWHQPRIVSAIQTGNCFASVVPRRRSRTISRLGGSSDPPHKVQDSGLKCFRNTFLQIHWSHVRADLTPKRNNT